MESQPDFLTQIVSLLQTGVVSVVLLYAWVQERKERTEDKQFYRERYETLLERGIEQIGKLADELRAYRYQSTVSTIARGISESTTTAKQKLE